MRKESSREKDLHHRPNFGFSFYLSGASRQTKGQIKLNFCLTNARITRKGSLAEKDSHHRHNFGFTLYLSGGSQQTKGQTKLNFYYTLARIMRKESLTEKDSHIIIVIISAFPYI